MDTQSEEKPTTSDYLTIGDFDFQRGDDDLLFNLYEESNSTILYGTSGQGKSYLMRRFIKRFLNQPNTTVLILKNTIEKEDDKALYVYSRKNPKRLHFASFVDSMSALDDNRTKNEREEITVNEFLSKLRMIIDLKRENAIDYFHNKITHPNDEQFVVLFDDILGFSQKMLTKINAILKELSVQGRHSDFKTYILVQHYKSVKKITRSNVNVFSALTPIDPEYSKQVWEEYFRVGKYNDFVKYTRSLPRYSKIVIKKSTGEFFVIDPTPRN